MIEEIGVHSNKVNELLGWTMIKNSKFLEAIRFYQVLCREKNGDSIWFYLLAMCLFKSNLLSQSKKVFKHFINIEKTETELITNANVYLKKIAEES